MITRFLTTELNIFEEEKIITLFIFTFNNFLGILVKLEFLAVHAELNLTKSLTKSVFDTYHISFFSLSMFTCLFLVYNARFILVHAKCVRCPISSESEKL